MAGILELDHLKFPLEHIKSATNNFSNDSFIGGGGFGKVYKGKLRRTRNSLRDPRSVAIKRLDRRYGQGDREFLNEIAMLASYKHNNLVSLVGFCDEGGEKIIIYKYEARGSLDKYLASNDLTWVQWIQICLGAACGLNYLHTIAEGHRVLHRDIKSANVLLSENWEAKISDFGLARIGPRNQQFTFVAASSVGTAGYVDPVYHRSGLLTKESDVYSFGVLLFEVLCGRPAAKYSRTSGSYNLLSELATFHYEAGTLEEIIAPRIRNQINPDSLRIFSTVAYKCLKTDRSERPTMAQVVERLRVVLSSQHQTVQSRGRITETELWGSSSNGTPWSLKLKSNQKLRKITINHEAWIYKIEFTIKDLISGLSDSSRHGSNSRREGRIGRSYSEVIIDADEDITRIDTTVGLSTGRYAGHTVIKSLSFITNKKRHGPFGENKGTRFSVTCDVGSFAGFFGRDGLYLDGFGCYFKR